MGSPSKTPYANLAMSNIIEFQAAATARRPEQPAFPQPANEVARLAALLEYDLLDSLPEQDFDDLTAIAAHICDTPIALVSLLDGDRQWFKSHHGIDATETPREHAFCAHAILQPNEVMVVPNALEDERFTHNPLVVNDPSIRFYAGAPLVNAEGMPLGTLCVIDKTPRMFTPEQEAALQALSRQVVAQMELRRQARHLQQDKQALQTALRQLRDTQTSLIQSEKMAALGELVGGMAHELNNPVTFIHGNLPHCQRYIRDLLAFIALYQSGAASDDELQACVAEIDLDYIVQDLPALFSSMKKGAERVQAILQALQTFSHHAEVGVKNINLHDDLDAVCELLHPQFQATENRPPIQLVKQYGDLPRVACLPSQLNQAWMQLVKNAVDALRQNAGCHHSEETLPQITITTAVRDDQQIQVTIADNGIGISPERQSKIFEPFYTNQTVGMGMGMGLATSYQIIVNQHQGAIACQSWQGWGTTMTVTLPLHAPCPLAAPHQQSSLVVAP
ncbi:MAG: GAF domain-containing sensor histidine kinase [Cyanobacteria bacterium P01_G01_bin.54]